MSASSKYWNIWQISLASTGAGYKYSLVTTAREFFQKKCANSQLEDTQTALLSYFHATTADTEAALAGLCLRCYISEFILKACKKIDYLFGSEKHFNYLELLPFVLNDDGETLIVLGSDHKTQFVLNNNSETHTPTYKFFSMRILQTFKIDSQRRMSLDNWVYLQTKQNPELKDFLSENGFKHLSDWALLNRARPKHLERLSVRERRLLEVFHAVYRRDRLQQHQKGARRCQDPSKLQLQEMLHKLQDLDIIIHSTEELMKEIKQVATQFRHYDIWSSREPLEIKDQDTGNYTPRPDLPTDSLNEADIEDQEFVDLFHEQLELALDSAIKSEIRAIITKLEKSKNYAPFAQKFIPGLQLYYCDQLSLKEITPKLGMTSWDQARRILNPGELLSKVRTSTVQQLLNSILKKASEKGLTKIPPEPEYLKTLLVQIEAFCDREIFTEAAEEIRAGKNRSLDSFYADQLRLYFQQHS
ncbi:MAG: hypothetical protein PUP93_07545 [Rhizonema sp. NSF051]|nr:hypothetical protein [Rhizonema sp. NSF051]